MAVKIDRRMFLAASGALGMATRTSATTRQPIEIRRDPFGVPYISGPTDAACIYGLGYAQGEDGFRYIEDCYLRAVGRGAEVHGAEALDDDRMVRALEIPQISKAEYARSSPQMRAIYDSFVAGLERFAADSGARLAYFERIEPWLPLALLRYKYYVKEFVGYSGLTGADRAAPPERPNGSNAWAVAPSKTRDGHALLLINPHVEFFGPARYYECTLQSDEGLRFQGITRYGLPIPYMGHNDQLGWAHTDNYPDFCDLYAEDIREAGGHREYRYGSEWRPVRQWTETLRIKRENGNFEDRRETFSATHHGPIVGHRDGRPLTIRMARLQDGGWLDQQYAMCRARDLAEFRSAASRCAVPYMNIVYADRAGNIFYAYGGAVPRRSEAYDWSKPVDGTDPGTDWQGYHRFAELPQVLNPPSGFIQSCNSSPFTVAGQGPDRRNTYPRYMIGPEEDNLRAKQSRTILESRAPFDFERWQEAATDSHLYAAREAIADLAKAWNALDEGPRRQSLGLVMEELRQWDGTATLDSTATTIFVRWHTKVVHYQGGPVTPEIMLQLLEKTRDDLVRAFGRFQVPWGEINRLQRVPWNAPVKFSDERPSIPVRGAPGWTGVIFNFYTLPPQGTKRIYGNLGNSYVAAVEFSPVPQTRTVLVFGQAMEPGTPHYLDQAELYADGKFKPAWWSRSEVVGNTKRTMLLRWERGMKGQFG